MFVTYRLIELRCLKIGNLKEKNVFWKRQFRSFDAGTVTENQRHKNFVLVSSSFKAYCKLHRLSLTLLDAMMDIRVSG